MPWPELLTPAAYEHDVADVELIETHISWVLLAGAFVFKVKKPVDLGFLDFTTVARRRHFCEEEVRLNRRLARAIYLGVAALRRRDDGTVGFGGAGEIVDWAVHMVRLPREQLMDRLLDEGRIDNERMNELARLLVDFHRAAPTGEGVDEYGAPEAIRANALENFAQLAPFVGPDRVLGEGLLEHLRAWTERELAVADPLLRRRVAAGRIRDGHGDLHSGNVCFTPTGVIAYDCIEFTPRFRCGDVAADLAFLVMDLEYRSFRGFGRYLVYRYAELSGDEELRDLVGFYRVYRAIVRAKVAAFRVAELEAAADEAATGALAAALAESRRYVQLAVADTLPPCLIALCGLPGTGKSRTALALARPFEAMVLASDVIRKDLYGLRPTERVPDDRIDEIYGAAATERTYAVMLDRARAGLAEGRTVILDANHPVPALRRGFLDLAAAVAGPWLLIEVDAPAAVVEERLRARERDPDAVSDAGLDVYRQARARYQAPTPAEVARFVRVDGTAPAEAQVQAALERLVAAD